MKINAKVYFGKLLTTLKKHVSTFCSWYKLVQLAELILANSPNEIPSTRRIYFRQLAEFGNFLVSLCVNKITNYE